MSIFAVITWDVITEEGELVREMDIAGPYRDEDHYWDEYEMLYSLCSYGISPDKNRLFINKLELSLSNLE